MGGTHHLLFQSFDVLDNLNGGWKTAFGSLVVLSAKCLYTPPPSSRMQGQAQLKNGNLPKSINPEDFVLACYKSCRPCTEKINRLSA